MPNLGVAAESEGSAWQAVADTFRTGTPEPTLPTAGLAALSCRVATDGGFLALDAVLPHPCSVASGRVLQGVPDL
jgi:hypothetical protein